MAYLKYSASGSPPPNAGKLIVTPSHNPSPNACSEQVYIEIHKVFVIVFLEK